MTRDYSLLFGSGGESFDVPPLARLGWQTTFARQTDADEMVAFPPVRVLEVHRSGLVVKGDGLDETLPPRSDVTVGDWLMFDRERPSDSRLLDRKSLFRRRAAGHDRETQLIASNVDTVFVVTSCNRDFNVARLERYLTLAFDAGADPVLVLTKADLSDEEDRFEREAQAISDKVPVLTVNAKSPAVRDELKPWLGLGRTVAFLGTSGVGKSTLVNALLGEDQVATGDIREDDLRGRHTTTRRQLLFTPDGTGVLDTPGMRELQLADVEAGLSELFGDIEDIAARCKFRDCAHETEPGCAVRAAMAAGELDASRMERWKKLVAEDRHNTESLAERHARERKFGKMVKEVVKDKKSR